MLQVRGISCRFGGLVALDNISLEVKRGELVGLMGPNGAGKTTLFNIINNLVSPTTGGVWFEEEEITGLPPHEITRRGLVRTFQNVRVFEHLNVLENVEVAVPENNKTGFLQNIFAFSKIRLSDRFIKDKASECLKMVGLASFSLRSSSSLTFGQQRLLGIARALACKPKILLLDEPSAGLNREETLALSRVIEKIHQKKIAIFIIEHDIEMLMSLVQRIIVLDKGRKIMEGTPDEIKGEEKVLKAYFGRNRGCPI